MTKSRFSLVEQEEARKKEREKREAVFQKAKEKTKEEMDKKAAEETGIQSMRLDQLKTELAGRVAAEERAGKKIEREYPYWGKSVEAKILEGLIRGPSELKEGSENQLRSSIRAFDEWKAEGHRSEQQEHVKQRTD